MTELFASADFRIGFAAGAAARRAAAEDRAGARQGEGVVSTGATGWQRRLASGALVSVLAVTFGCTDERAAGEYVVVDSAGVRIVTSTAALWDDGSAWQLDASPLLELGGADGEPGYEFHQLVAARRLRDRSIVVANAGTHEVRRYDAEGRLILSLGGEGEGPGEFRSLAGLQVAAADTLLVYDDALQRLTVFAPGGELVRTLAIRPPRAAPLAFVGVLSDGSLVFREGWSSADATAAQRDGKIHRSLASVLRYSADGALLGTIGSFAGFEFAFTALGMGPPPFGRGLSVAVYGNAIYVGTQDSGGIAEFSADGTQRRRIRTPLFDLPVEAADIAAFRTQLLAELPAGAEARQAVDVFLAQWPVPDRRPAYTDMLFGPAGDLWLADYAAPRVDAQAWTIFDAEGRLLGRVLVPHRFRILEVGDDHVLARAADDLGVERVRLHRIVRP